MSAQSNYVLYVYPKIQPKLSSVLEGPDNVEAPDDISPSSRSRPHLGHITVHTEDFMKQLGETGHTYGPDSRAVLEAAASNLDPETTGFIILEVEPLDIAPGKRIKTQNELTPRPYDQREQNKLSQDLDRQTGQRAKDARELQP